MNTDTNSGSLKGKEFIGSVLGGLQNCWENCMENQAQEVDRIQISSCLGLEMEVPSTGHSLERGTKKLLGMMKIFCILIVRVVIWD